MTVLYFFIIIISWLLSGCIAYWLYGILDCPNDDDFVFCIWLGYLALGLIILAIIGSKIKRFIDKWSW